MAPVPDGCPRRRVGRPRSGAPDKDARGEHEEPEEHSELLLPTDEEATLHVEHVTEGREQRDGEAQLDDDQAKGAPIGPLPSRAGGIEEGQPSPALGPDHGRPPLSYRAERR
jgi:hypothetical protein